MFCDQCHWYTAGEKICPHCGAEQKPPEPDNIFGIRRPEPAPKPAPAPVPPAPPASAPPPPPPAPAPKPAPAPVPLFPPTPVPPPKPVPPPPKPAPPPSSGGNKQGIKALALVLIGVVVLVIVLFFVEMSREEAYYTSDPDYGDAYLYVEPTAPPLEEAQAGDLVFLDDAQWWVLVAGEHALLLLMEDEIYLEPEEVVGYLDENGMFLLSPEEMAAYGFPPPEDRYDQLTSLRPAKWVTVR